MQIAFVLPALVAIGELPGRNIFLYAQLVAEMRVDMRRRIPHEVNIACTAPLCVAVFCDAGMGRYPAGCLRQR
jgi:hypothetical protein